MSGRPEGVQEELVELMARAGYEEWRSRVPHRPPWEDLTEVYANGLRTEARAGLVAVAAAGWKLVKP